MLAIRFLRAGRTNKAFFRIVLTESSRPPKSGFLKILGWYDPHSKETSLQKEEILSWLDKGAKASNSVAKLLNANDIKHKQATYVQDNSKASKQKEDEKAKPKAETAEVKTEGETAATDEAPEVADEATSEVVETPESTAETNTEASEDEVKSESEEEAAETKEETDNKNKEKQ